MADELTTPQPISIKPHQASCVVGMFRQSDGTLQAESLADMDEAIDNWTCSGSDKLYWTSSLLSIARYSPGGEYTFIDMDAVLAEESKESKIEREHNADLKSYAGR